MATFLKGYICKDSFFKSAVDIIASLVACFHRLMHLLSDYILGIAIENRIESSSYFGYNLIVKVCIGIISQVN